VSQLSEYNPLAGIWLKGAAMPDPAGVIAVVGPNSSGKTRFLHDIERYLTTGKKEFSVLETIAARKPRDLREFIASLESRRYIQPAPGVGPELYQIFVPFLGKRTDRQTFHTRNVEQSHTAFVEGKGGDNPGFFKVFGLALVAWLSLEERRTLCNKSTGFAYQSSAPDAPIQGLELRPKNCTNKAARVWHSGPWRDTAADGLDLSR
jgi:hypothetical protein